MIRLATVGTGWIVGEFLKGVREAGGICYTACYSRDQQRGEAFAEEWGAQKVYTDLAQMAADEEIDAVYIQPQPPALRTEQAVFAARQACDLRKADHGGAGGAAGTAGAGTAEEFDLHRGVDRRLSAADEGAAGCGGASGTGAPGPV